MPCTVTAKVLSTIGESEDSERDVPDFRSEPGSDTSSPPPAVDPTFFQIPVSAPHSFGPSVASATDPTLLRNLPPAIIHLQARISTPILDGDFACICNLALFSKRGCKRGSECTKCHKMLWTGAHLYHCRVCKRIFCLQCRNMQPRFSLPDVQDAGTPLPVAPDHNIDDLRATRLARILEGFDSKTPLYTVLHCPRAHASRFGDLFSLVFWHFSWFASSKCSSRDHQIWASLLLKFLPALILGFSSKTDSDEGHSAASQIRRRLQLAERGKWELLFDDYLERCRHSQDCDSVPRASRPPTVNKMALYRAACKKVAGNCLRSAVQILGGSGQPPPCGATFEAVQRLFVDPGDHVPNYSTLLGTIADKEYVTSLPLRSVTRRALNSRNGAQPGPSGTRNSHIKMCLRCRLGAEALQAWSCAWAAASMPHHMSECFLDGWVAPLYKPNLSLRPIALFESTLKLATGSLLEVSTKAISSKIFPRQFGAGTPAGAEAMLRMSQSLARALPDYAMIGTDVKTAFGTLHRLSVLTAIADVSPDLLPTF